MKVLPISPVENASPEGLRAFLDQCRAAARAIGRARLVSISLRVDALDPLAVLESIFEPKELHFYVEHPREQLAVAGAEAVISFEAHGADRFVQCQAFIDRTLEDAIAVGDIAAPFGGPHFFAAFSFFDEIEESDPFPAARLFIPRWQVGRRGDETVAVANVLVAPDADLGLLADKIWRAHRKFHRFDYSAADFGNGVSSRGVAQAAPVGSDEDFRDAVRTGLGAIRSGEFRKIVLARAKDVTATDGLHPLAVLNGLRQKFADCYAFSVADGRGRSFIGASPERLLQVAANEFKTTALAGSAPRGRSASEDGALASALLRSEKDQHEHRLVLESMRRRLQPLGLTLEHSETPRILPLANVQHLHTPVRATLPPNVRLLDVLARLHPTPAVGGSPREAACARIRNLEPFSRGLYAGPIGWIDHRGGGEFLVAIRSALVEGKKARVYAGVGVVEGSTPEKEFAETEWKFKALLDALLGGGG